MKTKPVSIFSFIDYRSYLVAFFNWHKEHTRGYSHRKMASLLGFSSPNFLKLVMDGSRNIGKESLQKICTGIGLNKSETEYFSYLVFFNQAKNTVEKNYFFGLVSLYAIIPMSDRSLPNNMNTSAKRHDPAIRELAVGKTAAARLRFPFQCSGTQGFQKAKVKKSVKLLKRLDLLRADERGVLFNSSPILNTENEINAFAVRRYHGAILEVAGNALEEVPAAEREFEQLTIRVSMEGYAKIKKRLQDFRGELLQMVSDDNGASKGIYHVNFQSYPLTRGYDYTMNTPLFRYTPVLLAVVTTAALVGSLLSCSTGPTVAGGSGTGVGNGMKPAGFATPVITRPMC